MTGKHERHSHGGKHLTAGLLKRFWNWLKDIPHLFAKSAIVWCLLCGTMTSAYALRILSRTGHDPAALLGAILSFFGGELLMLLLKTVLGNKR